VLHTPLPPYQDRAAIFLRSRLGIPDAYTLDPPLQDWGRDSADAAPPMAMRAGGSRHRVGGSGSAQAAVLPVHAPEFDAEEDDYDPAAAAAIMESLGRGSGGSARAELMRAWSDADGSRDGLSSGAINLREAEIAASSAAALAAAEEEEMVQLAIQASLALVSQSNESCGPPRHTLESHAESAEVTSSAAHAPAAAVQSASPALWDATSCLHTASSFNTDSAAAVIGQDERSQASHVALAQAADEEPPSFTDAASAWMSAAHLTAPVAPPVTVPEANSDRRLFIGPES
jgi:hypothetical protein